ncbi:hydrogenase/urease maturation nickel metallochaperone HypA [Halobacteriovorax sp. GFR7]|uniref:hydrogenase/urease maturation nickel metallochaperone HypA n=1 Tax=unclassified Halobacteriovorax TaxID=2639665 RepID=UPI003D970CF0
MHEFSLINNLIGKIETLANENKASKVTRVKVTLGALSHISAEHFKDHFYEGVRGTVAQDAKLDIVKLSDTSHPQAEEIILDSIDVE